MTSSELPLVTVLTPAYNAADHIAECIESVLRQSYTRWIYVIADNCSSDATPEIVRSYVDRDARIRYRRHEQFVDVNASYNRTFEEVEPESTYTKVVGADDWLYPDCLSKMVAVAESHRTVGIVSAYRLDNTELGLIGVSPSTTVVPGHAILRQNLLGGPNVTGSPTNILVRSELVRQRQPFWDLSFRHGDTEAVFRILTSWDLGFVHEVLTFTRRPPAGEFTVAQHLGSLPAEDIRLLIRYGPDVLTKDEFDRRLRRELKDYLNLQARWRIKGTRRRDPAFHDFHRRSIDAIRSEGSDLRTIHWATAAAKAILGPAPT